MRWLSVFAVGLALAGPALAQPAPTNALTYYCDGFARQPNGDTVAVMYSFSGDGITTDSFVIWSPLAAVVSPSKPSLGIDLELQLQYSKPTATDIGTPDGAFLTVQTLAPYGSKKTSQALQSDLARLTVEASFDGSPPVALAWHKAQSAYDLPMTANRRVAILIPPSSRQVTFTVLDRKGKIINTPSFDLQGTAGRDAQYRLARIEADKAALDYKSCTKVG